MYYLLLLVQLELLILTNLLKSQLRLLYLRRKSRIKQIYLLKLVTSYSVTVTVSL